MDPAALRLEPYRDAEARRVLRDQLVDELWADFEEREEEYTAALDLLSRRALDGGASALLSWTAIVVAISIPEAAPVCFVGVCLLCVPGMFVSPFSSLASRVARRRLLSRLELTAEVNADLDRLESLRVRGLESLLTDWQDRALALEDYGNSLHGGLIAVTIFGPVLAGPLGLSIFGVAWQVAAAGGCLALVLVVGHRRIGDVTSIWVLAFASSAALGWALPPHHLPISLFVSLLATLPLKLIRGSRTSRPRTR